MTTIIAGSAATFSVTVLTDNSPVPITNPLTISVYTWDGKTQLLAPITQTAGDGWDSGVVNVALTADQTQPFPVGDVILVLQAAFGIKRFRLTVETLAMPTQSSLFIKDIVVEELRANQLVAAAAGFLGTITVTDDYLWSKIRAAESDLTHTLRVPLVPTQLFPIQPTQDQIDALDGMAWQVEDSPDYDPNDWVENKWGLIVTRTRPIIAIQKLSMKFPTTGNNFFDIPDDWLKFDARYGNIRVVATSSAIFMAGAFVSFAGIGNRLIPSMMQLTYQAGLTNVQTDWPEILDLIKKMAILKIIQDAYLPSSGSISSDGHSESFGMKIQDFEDSIDYVINGAKGSNGGLMARIHGIRVMVA
jgi:hypothetical protein